jgi:scyllo-inositol 2-dehydrogenase (NADP+)
LGRRRPGAEVDDDTFVALQHGDGATSHLWASSVVARPGPRFRVLGSRAGYVVWGMDPQEKALHDGLMPATAAEWGAQPPGLWGTVGVGDDVAAVPTEPGDYGRFYAGVVAWMRHDAPPPVAPTDALRTLETIDFARRSAALGRPVACTPAS